MSHAPRVPVPRVRAPPLTHFIGLSLVTPASRPQLQTSLDAFRYAVKNDKDLLILDPATRHGVRPVDTLHLTICTLSLPSKEPERLLEVIQHLKEFDIRKLWREAQRGESDEEKERTSGAEPTLPISNFEPANGNDGEQPFPVTSAQNSVEKSSDTKQEEEALPPVRVTLKGISTMRNVKSTTVVYAPPDDPAGTLQRFCTAIREDFRPFLPSMPTPRDPAVEGEPTNASHSTPSPGPATEPAAQALFPTSMEPPHTSPTPPISPPPLSKRQQKRIAKKELRCLLLHATILNTIYVRKRNRKDKRPITIDARPLLEKFKDQVWMKDVVIEKLALYRMGAKEVLDEEERRTGVVRYVSEAERELRF